MLSRGEQRLPGPFPTGIGRSASFVVVWFSVLLIQMLPLRGEQSIYVLVNDKPISRFDVDQRSNLLMMGSSDVSARLRRKLKSKDIQSRFRKFAKKFNPKSAAEVKQLQKKFVATLRRQALSESAPRVKRKALSELIDEALKMQEAKKLSIVVSKDEVNKVLGGIAKRNKQSIEQLAATLRKSGVNIVTMRQRIRANLAWRSVIRRRYRRQVNVGAMDIDRVLASGDSADANEIELQLHKITVPLPGRLSQKVMIEKYDAAERIRRSFKSCRNIAQLASQVSGSIYNDLGSRRISTLPSQARPLLLAAEPGNMAPAVITTAGIELYAVCGRKQVAGNVRQRAVARDKLEQEQLTQFAKRLLSDICKDAFIEYRGKLRAKRQCGSGA